MSKLITMPRAFTFYKKIPAHAGRIRGRAGAAVFVLAILASSHVANAIQQPVPAKPVFAAQLTSPTAITFCGGSIWAYSLQPDKLTKINADTGAVSASTGLGALGIQGAITALGCAASDVLIGTETGSKSTFFYRLPVTVANARAKAISIPGKGLIRDAFCKDGSNLCFVIRDKVYQSGNLQNWHEVEIPASSKIPAGQEKVGQNPFAGWQDQFVIAEGQYFRGQLLDSTLYLLDPLRASVVTSPFPLKPGATPKKWGKWGVWESKMMWAKGFAPLGPDFVAISDTGLKLVFVFTNSGDYVGSFGADGGAVRFKYPLDIASSKSRLFVADAEAGKIYAFDVAAAKAAREFKLPQKAEDLTEVLRMNLFRDPAVLNDRLKTRCLGCHDGLLVNSLKKFVGPGKHHPLYVEPSTKIDLPLEAGKMVTCSSCHDSHHASLGKKGMAGAMLRKPLKPLCTTCHASKGNAATNHPQMNPDEACAECHAPHGGNEFLLKKTIPALCIDCHGAEIIPNGHPDMQECTSCHSLHDAQAKFKFATHSGPNAGTKVTCFGCHEDKKPLIGKSYHLGEESQLPHAWPQPEAVCLDCHNPHKKMKEMKQVCAQCHSGITGTHPASIPIAETDVAKAVHLKGDKVVCTTCHEPHGTTPPNPDGRSFFKDNSRILPFCAGCHGDEAKDYYKNFHKRTK